MIIRKWFYKSILNLVIRKWSKTIRVIHLAGILTHNLNKHIIIHQISINLSITTTTTHKPTQTTHMLLLSPPTAPITLLGTCRLTLWSLLWSRRPRLSRYLLGETGLIPSPPLNPIKQCPLAGELLGLLLNSFLERGRGGLITSSCGAEGRLTTTAG